MPHPIELILPGEPAAVRLMNTVWADRSGVHDALDDVEDLRTFLAGTGVTGGGGVRVDPAHLWQARRLRDALRRLASAVVDDDRPRAATDLTEGEALDAVNAAMAAAPGRVLRRTADGWALGHADEETVDAALGALAQEGAELVADPVRRLRACRAPGCVLYFVRDHHRREWCSVSCGNRARAARYYRRSRSAGA